MKKVIFLITVLTLSSCVNKPKELIGIWHVKTPYHRAIYSIEEYNNKIVGKVNYYNDDTFVYQKTGTEKDIFLHKIERKKNIYVDAVSGATITNKNLIIKLKNQDTLEVTKYIHKKPLKEFWIKKQ